MSKLSPFYSGCRERGKGKSREDGEKKERMSTSPDTMPLSIRLRVGKTVMGVSRSSNGVVEQAGRAHCVTDGPSFLRIDTPSQDKTLERRKVKGKRQTDRHEMNHTKAREKKKVVQDDDD